MKKLFTLILIVFLAGCIQEEECTEPYVVIGEECCIDFNSNNVCDLNEGADSTRKTTTKATTTTTTTLKLTTTTTSSSTTTSSTTTTVTYLGYCNEYPGESEEEGGYCKDYLHGDEKFEDYCRKDATDDIYYLSKYKCAVNNTCILDAKAVQCEYACRTNECVEPSGRECFETDSGDTPLTPGVIISGEYGILKDLCSYADDQEDILRERYCKPEPNTITYNCSQLCWDCTCLNATDHPRGIIGYCGKQ